MVCPICLEQNKASVFWISWAEDQTDRKSVRVIDEFGVEHWHIPGRIQYCKCSNGHYFRFINTPECSINKREGGYSDADAGQMCEWFEAEKMESLSSEPTPKYGFFAAG